MFQFWYLLQDKSPKKELLYYVRHDMDHDGEHNYVSGIHNTIDTDIPDALRSLIEAGTRMQFNDGNIMLDNHSRLSHSIPGGNGSNKHDFTNSTIVSVIEGRVYPLVPEGVPYLGHTRFIPDISNASQQVQDFCDNIDGNDFVYSIRKSWKTNLFTNT